MRLKNLVPHISTGESDNSFVGMKILGNDIHFYYPESYRFDADDFSKEDVLDLLKTISLAKSSSSDLSNSSGAKQTENNLALLSYIWVLEDYLRNGVFISESRVLKPNQKGKVNWKSTFRQQPMISGMNVVYPNLIAEVKNPIETILVDAHRYCIKKSAMMIGWLYGVHPSEVETAGNSQDMVPQYLDAVKYELDRTFDDEKRTRLTHMESVLIGLDEYADDDSIVYGVDSYHYVYERMIDCIFGTEKVDEYYPKFVWNLKYSSEKDGLSGPTIRPDTIMKYGDEDNLYIIDSKFYRYGALDLSHTRGLPEASSIVKQITYGSYVKNEHQDINVYNAFIIPYNSESVQAKMIDEKDKTFVYVGNVLSEWENDKTYGRIYTFLIDLRYVVKIWNRNNHDEDQKNLVSMISEQSAYISS